MMKKIKKKFKHGIISENGKIRERRRVIKSRSTYHKVSRFLFTVFGIVMAGIIIYFVVIYLLSAVFNF